MLLGIYLLSGTYNNHQSRKRNGSIGSMKTTPNR